MLNDTSSFYFENGSLKSKGYLKNRVVTGQWKEFKWLNVEKFYILEEGEKIDGERKEPWKTNMVSGNRKAFEKYFSIDLENGNSD